jgi:hypothetical protein
MAASIRPAAVTHIHNMMESGEIIRVNDGFGATA